MTQAQPELDAVAILPEPALPDHRDLVSAGLRLAHDWRLGDCAFLTNERVPDEAAYKRRCVTAGQVMLHAQIGYRDPAKSREAAARIFEAAQKAGRAPDRYGICLDWSMGFPSDRRDGRQRGTGMILSGPEDFAALTAAAPVAPHFGDFVLGFPAACENTCHALAAGSTAIGNLGQYFTFRLPGCSDDVSATAETVKALALIAAQPQEILVHSNLDDGFAARFRDHACSLGMALVERYIVEELMGARLSHCFGHHFSEPRLRLALQRALAEGRDVPGTMIYGETIAYRGADAANYAALGSYLAVDVLGQLTRPSGHAVNPVPVTENRRIPEIDEVSDALIFADRLTERCPDLLPLFDQAPADALARELMDAAEVFRQRLFQGLAQAGLDLADPFRLLLVLRRLGAETLEARFGPRQTDGARAVAPSRLFADLAADARRRAESLEPKVRERLANSGLKVVTATSDVHRFGKELLDRFLEQTGVEVVDGGISVDPAVLAEQARGADLLAVSTYNGVALDFVAGLQAELAARGLNPAICIGGRLNQIPEGSNSSLPVEVGKELGDAGVCVCREIEDIVEPLLSLTRERENKSGEETIGV
jgi:methylmalonyl-CoA mutase cobalamin-binding subunit